MLYFYYGEECPHCHEMMPVVDKMIAEGIEIQKLETWHNDDNAKLLQEADNGKCGGVPFFINSDSGEWICGSTSEEMLRKWAAGEKLSDE